MDSDVGVLCAVERGDSDIIQRFDGAEQVAIVAVAKGPALQPSPRHRCRGQCPGHATLKLELELEPGMILRVELEKGCPVV